MRKLARFAGVFLFLTLALGMTNCSSNEAEEEGKREIVSEAPTAEKPVAEVSETEAASLLVINRSGVNVTALYLSPSDSDDWGVDRLGDAVLADGDSFTLELEPGVYDGKGEDSDGEVVDVVWAMEVEGSTEWVLTGQVRLEVINESGQTLAHIYTKAAGGGASLDDWLAYAGQTLPPGASFEIELPRGAYDVWAETAGGELVEAAYDVALNGEVSWTVLGSLPLPAGARSIFADDFSDNRNNWGQTGEGEDVHYMPPTGGEYCMLIKVVNLTAWEWYEPVRMQDFVAEVACRVEGGEAPACGLGHGPDGDNLIWFEVSPRDQSYALFFLQDDEWQEAPVNWSPSVHINPWGTNTLRLQRVDGTVSLVVNGSLLEEVQDSFFPEGRLGFGGSTYEGQGVTVCLDDLQVWRVD